MRRTGIVILGTFFANLFCDIARADDDDDDEDLSDLEPDEAEDDGVERVIALTDETFADFIKKNKKVLVEFYAPWCGHCKALAPDYEKAAKELHKRKSITKLVKIDADQEKRVAADHGIQGFPTLFYYDQGVKSKYDGPREPAGIVQWLVDREATALPECKEGGVASANYGDHKYVFVAHVKPKSGRAVAAFKGFREFKTPQTVVSASACQTKLPKGADPKADATLTLYRKSSHYTFIPESESFSGVWSASSIKNWMFKSQFTQFTEVTSGAMELFTGMSSTLVILSFENDLLPEESPLIDGLKKYKHPVMIQSRASSTKDADERIPKDWGEGDHVVLNTGPNIYYTMPFTDKTTVADIDAHIESAKKGKAERWFKSAKVPEGDDAVVDGVTVLVGKTFGKVALDPKKDVFVKFYAPWCGHCKTMAPEWSGFAKKLAKELPADRQDKYLITKIDATENESEEEITGFPKLVLYPASKNSFRNRISYEKGERKADDFYHWFLENAKNLADLVGDSESSAPAGGKKKKKYSMVERELARKRGEKLEL